MGRYGIDYVSVKDAAEQLAASGDSVTVEKIRHALGSGSFTTLGRHLRTWRRTQDPAVGQCDAMPEMINDAAQAVWSNLSRAADERVREAQEAAQSAVAAAQDAAQEQLAASQQAHSEASRSFKIELQHLQLRLDERSLQLSASQQLQQETEAARQKAVLEAARSLAELGQIRQHLHDESQQVARLVAALKQAEAQVVAERQALMDTQQLHREQQTQAEDTWATAQESWDARQKGLERQLAREQREVDRLRAAADTSNIVQEQMQQLSQFTADVSGQRQAHEAQVSAQLEALQQGAGDTIAKLQAIWMATREETIRRLFELSQQSAENRYENLMGAIAARGAPTDQQS